jgi:predicted Zn-dependent protease with MMP-like domain
MDRKRFESLVGKAIDELPEEFQQRLENVEIIVEDFPSPHQFNRLRLKSPYHLLGLYEGVPQTKRTGGYNLVPPDKISLFQKPIEAKCTSDRSVEKEVGKVLRHEIAHHFGIDDMALDRIEREKRKSK